MLKIRTHHIIPEPISSDPWQSMENQPSPTLSVISDRSELSGIGITALLAVLAVIWGAIGTFLIVERETALKAAEREVSNLAQALERQSFWLFANVEQLL